MHNAAFRVLGIDAVYVALPLDARGVVPVMRALADADGGGSVTRPHKAAAAAAIAHPSERVQTLGVCNTFWSEEGEVAGDNTDVAGVLHALGRVDVGLTQSVWAVAGTGASARAVVEAARQAGARVAVRSRSSSRASAFRTWMATRCVDPAELSEARVLINASPLGMGGDDRLPFGAQDAPDIVAAVDMVYRVGETPWVRAIRQRGVAAVDGREMLLGQGVAAFAKWFPGTPAPVEVMRAAVEDALRPGR